MRTCKTQLRNFIMGAATRSGELRHLDIQPLQDPLYYCIMLKKIDDAEGKFLNEDSPVTVDVEHVSSAKKRWNISLSQSSAAAAMSICLLQMFLLLLILNLVLGLVQNQMITVLVQVGYS